MRINKVLSILKKELRTIIRDKKSLLMMFIIPVMIPIFIFIFSYFYESIVSDEVKYNVGVNYELNNNETEIVNELSLNITEYKDKEEMQKAYEKGEIDSYVVKANDTYKIFSNQDDQTSGMSSSMVYEYLKAYNEFLGQNYLIGQDIEPEEVFSILNIEFEDLEGNSSLISQFISMGFVFAIMAIVLTASICSTDLIAGEKERGTLETMLTFPLKSSEIVFGKYLAILSSCLITSIISIILNFCSLEIARNMFEIYKDVNLNINVTTIIASLVIFISLSLLVSGLTIAIASFCKSYKESQEAQQPLTLLTMIPMFISLFGVKTTIVLSIIPIVGNALLLNDLVNGTVEVVNLIAMLVSTIIYIIITILYISKQFKKKVSYFLKW